MLNPFEKKTPSLFIVSTPLQVLCAMEAIAEFEIEQYSILVPYFSDEIRIGQTFSMLDFYKLKYQKYNIDKVGNRKMLTDMIRSHNEVKYSRAFIGYYADIRGKMVAFPYMKEGSNFVFLDDGAASISILKGLFSFSLKNRFLDRTFNLLSCWKKINVKDYFFTVYHDIPTSKTIYPNHFRHLRAGIRKLTKNGVYFIGTNTTLYCQAYGISLERYEQLLEEALKQFGDEFPNTTVYYIPHGRDKSSSPFQICKNLNVVYCKLDEAVESYLIKKQICPVAVAGFASSALYNIRKIMSETKVINYEVLSNLDRYKVQHAELNGYYHSNGIERRTMLA